MRKALETKIKNEWEPGTSLLFKPFKKKIKGVICISKRGNVYYRYDGHPKKY
jgi:hypothetical protein